MAEAVVQSPPSLRYFCHTCNVRIGRLQEDFTCPTCGGGFVEEVPEAPQQQTASAIPLSSLFGLGGQGSGNGAPFFLDMFFGGGSSQQRSQTPDRGGGRSGGMNLVEVRHSPGGTLSMTLGGNSASGGGGRGGGTNTGDNPMDQMLFTFLNELLVGLGGNGAGISVQTPIGNVGDYVWGRDGLDAIVTQLMNQMDGTGPPPLPTEKIDQLPSVRINQEQVDKKIQCSVCWDDFALDEEVKQLDCDHVFHPDCILPWLKLHGTCPICRRDFTEGISDEVSGSRSDTRPQSTATSPQLSFPFNIPGVTSNPGTPSSNTGGSQTETPSTATGSGNDNSGRGGTGSTGSSQSSRFNMDLEFD